MTKIKPVPTLVTVHVNCGVCGSMVCYIKICTQIYIAKMAVLRVSTQVMRLKLEVSCKEDFVGVLQIVCLVGFARV